jgi:protein required for attachment to host cells
MGNRLRISIVVADQAEARFYETLGFTRPLRFTGALDNPAAHLRDQGAVVHHSRGGENTPRRHATHLFARRVAAELARARRAGRFERAVLVAAPAFLGELRAALPASVRPYVMATVAKDIVHHAVHDVRRHLTRAMFIAPSGFPAALRA